MRERYSHCKQEHEGVCLCVRYSHCKQEHEGCQCVYVCACGPCVHACDHACAREYINLLQVTSMVYVIQISMDRGTSLSGLRTQCTISQIFSSLPRMETSPIGRFSLGPNCSRLYRGSFCCLPSAGSGVHFTTSAWVHACMYTLFLKSCSSRNRLPGRDEVLTLRKLR